ncbi:atypical kinase COQ8B, mitochondrial-like [Oratosquilla oratoria]|uniref:atypical kinase COQ8B, mitochondrial-like n=1 Tax=Oratosquilla oratoria TaxID=337810 RepID=UPI003F76ECA3
MHVASLEVIRVILGRLAKNAQAQKVPHSRIGRLRTFGGLAASLGAGTVAEMTRRTLGYRDGKGSGSLLDASPFLTEANAKRIVDTLCRVLLLKLGQMLSIQDNALINPQLQKIFERVRQSADFMPAWQLENALVKEFSPDWRTRVSSFDDHPFAAASLGQVHLATLGDGQQVAMKIQYLGVADGIESDINNLISTRVANILPEAWECDYEREYRCTKRFKELVQPYPEFYVPEVIDELSTKQVFTTKLIEGVAVDKCVDMDQETRNFVSEQVLRLCLMELFQFGFMQTDPNWANFFYNADTHQFGVGTGCCVEGCVGRVFDSLSSGSCGEFWGRGCGHREPPVMYRQLVLNGYILRNSGGFFKLTVQFHWFLFKPFTWFTNTLHRLYVFWILYCQLFITPLHNTCYHTDCRPARCV